MFTTLGGLYIYKYVFYIDTITSYSNEGAHLSHIVVVLLGESTAFLSVGSGNGRNFPPDLFP